MAMRTSRPPDRRRHRHGVVTSLGAGQAGQLGEADRRPVRHPRDHALCDRRAEDPHRRHGRFRADRARRSTRRSCRSASPRWRPRKRSRNPASARRGDFPGPLFLARRAGRDRMAAAPRGRASRPARTSALSYDDLTRAGETGRFRELLRALPVRLGRGPARGEVRHQGLADLALDRLRVRRDRDPARRRGDPARRDRRGAVHRHRRLGQRRSR